MKTKKKPMHGKPLRMQRSLRDLTDAQLLRVIRLVCDSRDAGEMAYTTDDLKKLVEEGDRRWADVMPLYSWTPKQSVVDILQRRGRVKTD